METCESRMICIFIGGTNFDAVVFPRPIRTRFYVMNCMEVRVPLCANPDSNARRSTAPITRSRRNSLPRVWPRKKTHPSATSTTAA